VRRNLPSAAVAAGLVLLLAACCPMESRFLRPVRVTATPPPAATAARIEADGGATLGGWVVRPAWAPSDARLPAILFLHGRGDSVADYADLAPAFADAVGAVVVLVDYRGWGDSEAVACPTRGTVVADARSALAYTRQADGVDPRRVAVWGVSMGAYPAAKLFADDRGLRALALWAGVADVHWLLKDHRRRLSVWRRWAGRLAIGDLHEPRHSLRRAGPRPVLIAHGERDRLVPPRHARELARSARAGGAGVELFLDAHSGHASVAPAVLDRIAIFLRAALGAQGPGFALPQGDSGVPHL